MVFSMTMSSGWLYMRAPAPTTGAVMYENRGKNLRQMILQNMFVGVPHAVNQRDTPQPIRKIPVNGCSRVQKFDHPVVDVAINEQCHRVLTMPLGSR